MMHRPTPPPQQGVVLIVVLIMLVVIGLTSAAVMRNALSADLVSANVRSEALATEAAQIALKFCEAQIILPVSTVPIQAAATPARWRTLANWASTAAPPPTTLTDAQVSSANASFRVTHLPQCMAETQALPGRPAAETVVVVTSRGFSSDYTESEGAQQSGSVVWLQSTLRLSAASATP
jgi:Tfp pilus assembly protein PilX